MNLKLASLCGGTYHGSKTLQGQNQSGIGSDQPWIGDKCWSVWQWSKVKKKSDKKILQILIIFSIKSLKEKTQFLSMLGASYINKHYYYSQECIKDQNCTFYKQASNMTTFSA